MAKFLLFVLVLAVIYLVVRASKRPKTPPTEAKAAVGAASRVVVSARASV